MDGTEFHHAERNKSSSEREMLHIFTHMWTLDLKIATTIIWHNCKKTVWGEPLREGVESMVEWILLKIEVHIIIHAYVLK
jgi:hypothetical protein